MRHSVESFWCTALVAAVAVGISLPSCSGDAEDSTTSAATTGTGATGTGAAGGQGGAGGSNGRGGGSSSSCMVAVGGCYDAIDCTPWAACECPELPCGADCVAYRECSAPCADSACVETCAMDHAAGAAEQNAILQCAHCGADRCLGSLCNQAVPPIVCP